MLRLHVNNHHCWWDSAEHSHMYKYHWMAVNTYVEGWVDTDTKYSQPAIPRPDRIKLDISEKYRCFRYCTWSVHALSPEPVLFWASPLCYWAGQFNVLVNRLKSLTCLSVLLIQQESSQQQSTFTVWHNLALGQYSKPWQSINSLESFWRPKNYENILLCLKTVL